jgi:imidazolonepropionase-like amidohydrolase
MAMEKGVRITFGPDCHHEPFRLADELALAVELGMSEMDAIVKATSGAAEACGIESDVGDLIPGKRADLLILGSDPLQDIRALKDIDTIVQGGKVVELSRSAA